jgi:hypothetical protein
MAQETLHRRGPEIHTGDMKVGQQPSISLDGPLDHEQVIIPVDTPLETEQTKNLAFAEEPVTIRIEPSSEKFAPKVVDCWVNGVGAEVFMNGRWHKLGVLPVGIPVTTKRKYVEVIARSKQDTVSTISGKPGDENPENRIERNTYHKAPFSVISDKNPVGAEWLTRLMAEG